MFIDTFTFLGNYLWEQSIQNIDAILGEHDSKLFTSNDYFYLTSIYYLNHPTMSELAKQHQVSKPAVSAIVRKLMKLGLVEKIQSIQDHRVFTLELTSRGLQIITGDKKQYEIIEKYLRKLIPSEEKYREFEDIMEKLANMVKENQDEKQKEF